MNALATALKVNVNIAYLDGHDQQGQVSFVPFQNAPFTVIEPVNLLYRCARTLSPSRWPVWLSASPPSYQTRALRYPGPEGRGSFGTPAHMNINLMGLSSRVARTADARNEPRCTQLSVCLSMSSCAPLVPSSKLPCRTAPKSACQNKNATRKGCPRGIICISPVGYGSVSRLACISTAACRLVISRSTMICAR